jgi:hypothetical protein
MNRPTDQSCAQMKEAFRRHPSDGIGVLLLRDESSPNAMFSQHALATLLDGLAGFVDARIAAALATSQMPTRGMSVSVEVAFL